MSRSSPSPTLNNHDAAGTNHQSNRNYGDNQQSYSDIYNKSIAPVYGDKGSQLNLPFIRPYNSTVMPTMTFPIVPPNFVQEGCGFKIIMGGAMGSVMGLGLGLFMGAVGDNSPIQVIQGREVPTAPLREQMRQTAKLTGQKAIGWAKNFGVLTALFGGVECVVEKHRSKHDVWNPVISGCIVGATLSAKGGPAAACLGCAGFSGFSFVIDKVMGGQH